MSINVINTNARQRVSTSAGTTREIVAANDDGAKDLRASIHEVEPNRSLEINSDKRTHLVYVMEGSGGHFSFKGENYPAKKGTGVYLEPGDRAGVSAGGTRLVLMHLNVPKHSKPISGSASSYYFDQDKTAGIG